MTVTLTAGGLACLTSCTDDVDDSNLYTFTGDVVSTYLQQRDDCALFTEMLSRVKTSAVSKSSVLDLLSARGNYTCFVPRNEAVRAYIDSVCGVPGIAVADVSDSILSEIVKTCIVDCKDEEAYRTASFQQEGSLDRTNMLDRYLTVAFDTMPGTRKALFIINNNAQIVEPDLKLENGYVHIVSAVPSTSSSTLPSLLQTAGNMRIFSRLLQETGWADQMTRYLDEEYEYNHPESGNGSLSSDADMVYVCPEHKKYGYTAFVEPDSLYIKEWGVPEPQLAPDGGITNWSDILSVVKQKCSEMELYTNTSDDLTSEDNAVNQFVAYHLLPQSVTYNKLVIHFCEMGFTFKNMDRLTVNLDELYTTMGKHRRLLKVTEGASTGGKRLNRYSKYDRDTYDEMQVFDPGALVQPFNGEYLQNALNGFYYPIDRILVYDTHTRDYVLNQRLRFDSAILFPEIMSSGLRRPNYTVKYNLPANFLDKEHLIRSDETDIIYKATFEVEWQDYNGDEIQAVGQYDFTILLPPVPADGTYELRLGLSNTGRRGMAQIYFGDNPNQLAACGLPLDMRITATNAWLGWEADTEDEIHNTEVDKRLRTKGYMKAPNIFGIPSTTGTTELLRNYHAYNQLKARKILYNGPMKAGKKYYARFKSLLSYTSAQFFLDYLELVPKNIYDNPTENEDIW